METVNNLIAKPKFRGILHAVAFFATCIGMIAFLLTSYFFKFDLGIFIYLISQLLQFGISSLYHVINWSPKQKAILQYLDHMCIFLLISGTQTSVLLNAIPQDKIKSALDIIKISWSVSIVGICRLLYVRKLHDIFDLVCYIIHGVIIVPFANTLKSFRLLDVSMCICGGILYIVGGVIYGLEKPNPVPSHFGFHEIFHLFTILANTCFAVVIVKDYIYSIISYFTSGINVIA